MKKINEITRLEILKAKEFAERNFEESAWAGSEGMTAFEFNGITIVNPWIDETGRFDLTDKEAIERYGLENVLNFIINILKEDK